MNVIYEKLRIGIDEVLLDIQGAAYRFSGGKIGYQIEIPLEDLQKVIELQTADVVKE